MNPIGLIKIGEIVMYVLYEKWLIFLNTCDKDTDTQSTSAWRYLDNVVILLGFISLLSTGDTSSERLSFSI